MQPLFGQLSVAFGVDIGSMRGTGRLPVNAHAESHWESWVCRPHHQVKVAGVEAARNVSTSLAQGDGLLPYRPVSRQGPVIERELRRDHIDVTLAWYRSTRRGEVLGAFIAGIVLW